VQSYRHADSRDLLKFGRKYISANVWEVVQGGDIVTMEDYNRTSHASYRTAPISMTLSDLEGHFSCLKTFSLTPIHRGT